MSSAIANSADPFTRHDPDRTRPELAAIAQAIAAELSKLAGAAWSFADNGYPHSAAVVDKDGRRFCINNSHVRGRYSISGDWHRLPHRREGSNSSDGFEVARSVARHEAGGAELPSITVAQEKAPAKIAADIARRFLPEFCDVWDRAAKMQLGWRQHEAKRTANAKRLADVLGIAVHAGAEQKDRASWYSDGPGGYGELVASDETAELHLRSVPIDVAEQILKLVAPLIKPK